MLKEMNSIKSSEDGILTKLFRKILVETGFINSINYFINRYKGNKSRTTIGRLILDGEMTWNSFTFLAIEILKAKELTMDIAMTKDDVKYISSVTIKSNEYDEKTSGKYLKQSYDNMVKELGDKFNLKEYLAEYYKRGGKKNKATISKIMDSKIISWKSYMFLMFELLNNDELLIEVLIHNVHGKKTTHELIIKKSV
jgi:hypothetical protein